MLHVYLNAEGSKSQPIGSLVLVAGRGQEAKLFPVALSEVVDHSAGGGNVSFRPPGSLVRPRRRVLQMLNELVGSENYCLVEARSRLDARRPSGHATVPVDEHPCDFLRCQ